MPGAFVLTDGQLVSFTILVLFSLICFYTLYYMYLLKFIIIFVLYFNHNQV